jgi:hypothetical protein
MFYGTVVYDTFVKFLGEPPLKEKLRIRVHYGSLSSQVGYWDGAYANFSDAIPLQTSTASLDSIAHEIGHGVLNRLMGLTYLQPNMSADIRSLHEAFGDISGVVALHELAESEQNTNYWLHGEENHGSKRQTNEIITEYGAIPSVLDYNAANPNFYLRIGMISYPFYVLSQKWGIDEAYRVFIAAARNCWAAPQNFTQIATCIKQQASLTTKITNDSVTYNTLKKQRAADVISAFKQVKIKLFDAGVLSHFYAPEVTELSNGFSVQFTDDSRTTGEITQWLWDFGDGQTSTEKNPTHLYLNANKYEVKLTVTNQAYATDSILLGEGGVSNHKDDFTRQINVTKVAN